MAVADQRCRQRVHRGRRQVPAVQEQAGAAACRARCMTTAWSRPPAGRPTFSSRWAWASRRAWPRLAVDQQRAFISPDKIKSVLGDAELLIWTTESEADQAALLANPDVAAQRSRSVFTTKDQAGSDRLRVAAELSAGGRPVAAADRQRPALARTPGNPTGTRLPSSNGQGRDRNGLRLRRSGLAAAIRQHRRGFGVVGRVARCRDARGPRHRPGRAHGAAHARRARSAERRPPSARARCRWPPTGSSGRRRASRW